MATYTIDSVQDLIDLTLLSGKFAGIPWSENTYNLTVDLDLAGVDPKGDGKGWWPIGQWGSGTFFDGSFDGQGHKISNMTINRPDNDDGVGLFGAIDPDQGASSGQYDPVKNVLLLDVNVVGGNNTAGLIGAILGLGIAQGYTVNNCGVTGAVVTERIGGGLVAQSNNGYFVDCYSQASVTVAESRCAIGGLIGYDTIGTDCVRCYCTGLVNNTGPVTGDTEVGGMIGEADASYATDSFFDKTTSGKATDGLNGDAVGKITAEMKQQATFTNWDFTTVWWITEGSTYPALRVFGDVPTPAGTELLLTGTEGLRGVLRGAYRGSV